MDDFYFYKDFTTNYNSQYLKYANQTLSWLPSDSKELFFENIAKNRQGLIENGWFPPKSIEYKFNSYGFRCKEFSEGAQSILFLGCSYTVGIGLNLEDTFSHIVSNKINLDLINLGIGGSSADTAFRLGSYWIPKIKPKVVVHLPSGMDRIELVTPNRFFDLLPNYCPKDFKFFYEWVWLSDTTNSYMNALKNKLALEYICKENNIKFVYFNIQNTLKTMDLARDLMHPGVKSHLNFANTLLEHI